MEETALGEFACRSLVETATDVTVEGSIAMATRGMDWIALIFFAIAKRFYANEDFM